MGRVGGVAAEELGFESEMGCESVHVFVDVLCVRVHMSLALMTRLYIPRFFPFHDSNYLGIHLYTLTSRRQHPYFYLQLQLHEMCQPLGGWRHL